MAIGGTVLAVVMTTSFHTYTMMNSFLLLLTLGWIVTFIIDVRGGGPSSGYTSSGFFGGKK